VADTQRDIVLLVQPERDDRDMYGEFLRHVGLAPVAVSTATDALRLASSAAVIVTDIILSGDMDGIALITRLKCDDQMRRTPVIALTACAWPTARERALVSGCDVFLTKPCLPRVLTREIFRLLRHDDAEAVSRPGRRVNISRD